MSHPSRRAALGLALLAPAGLAGCSAVPDLGGLAGAGSRQGEGPIHTPDYAKVYTALPGEKFRVSAFDFSNVDPAFLRADVPYRGSEPQGTIVVDRGRRVLYLVTETGRARRYGIAVGPEAGGFSGTGTVAAKREWPEYNRPATVAQRSSFSWAQLTGRAQAASVPDQVPGGSKSPRGARGLYVAANGQDAGFVIHGTPNPQTVGTNVEVGCIALINQDVIDLYFAAAEGSRVVVA